MHGRNYTGHNYKGFEDYEMQRPVVDATYIDHRYIDHIYIGHNYLDYTYIGHNYTEP